MTQITRQTSVEELAALVSQTLEAAGIRATLSGGTAVTLYSDNEYESCDLDFITSERNDKIARALAPLGFHLVKGTRQFEHHDTAYYLEFPPGPLAFGETVVRENEVPILQTKFGPLRVVTPTQSVMDRLAAYVHWSDTQSLDQAAMVASRQEIDWRAVKEWARREGVDDEVIDTLGKRSARD